MKKILIMHHSGSIGGAGVSVFNTIMALKDDYEVVLYCPSNPSDFSEYLKEKGINVKTYDFDNGSIHYYSGGPPICSPGFLKGLLNIPRCWIKWENILNIEKPDLVIVNSKTLAWTSLFLNKKNFKSICHVRETRKNSLMNFWNSIQNRLLEKFDGVIFISNYDRELESLKRTKSMVIPNFLNLNNYKQINSREKACNLIGINPNSFNILFVGGMLKIKGFDVAVKSMKYLKNLDVNLVVAGDSNFHYKRETDLYSRMYNFAKKRYEKKINDLIFKENIEKNIIKIGIQKNMVDVYSTADVLIFPANAPHQARPVFEAGSQKVPVIMPDFANTLEYVRHGDNGLVFRRKDPVSLANSIKILINNENLRKTLGENNYMYTAKQHTKETSEKLLKEMIESVIYKSFNKVGG